MTSHLNLNVTLHFPHQNHNISDTLPVNYRCSSFILLFGIMDLNFGSSQHLTRRKVTMGPHDRDSQKPRVCTINTSKITNDMIWFSAWFHSSRCLIISKVNCCKVGAHQMRTLCSSRSWPSRVRQPQWSNLRDNQDATIPAHWMIAAPQAYQSNVLV